MGIDPNDTENQNINWGGGSERSDLPLLSFKLRRESNLISGMLVRISGQTLALENGVDFDVGCL